MYNANFWKIGLNFYEVEEQFVRNEIILIELFNEIRTEHFFEKIVSWVIHPPPLPIGKSRKNTIRQILIFLYSFVL